jgi:excisionase family DNA binding protein
MPKAEFPLAKRGELDTPHQVAWLNTSQAARVLGVHPTTVRRWADGGQLPVMVTPGGHRRFSAADLVAFENSRRHGHPERLREAWAHQAVDLTRRQIASSPNADWLSAYDEDARLEQRDLGRRMIGLILRYVSGEGDEPGILAEVQAIGRRHAQTAKRLGLSLADAMQASLFFRDRVIETAFGLSSGGPMPGGGSGALFERLTRLLNLYQLSVLEVYER